MVIHWHPPTQVDLFRIKHREVIKYNQNATVVARGYESYEIV